MQDAAELEIDSDPRPRLGWRRVAIVLVFYATCVMIATYPRILSLTTTLPSRADPVQHLTIMRWYKTCLVEGRSPLHWPEIQYPTGAPLGNFSPLQLQSLLYLPLSLICSNDILCYNILWYIGFLLAGMGTFALAWDVLRDRACACFAGLLAMLGTPMMLHAIGHLELMYVGLFPLFLAAWMRFLDRPSRRTRVWAGLLYLLMVTGAAYFAVLAVIPAVLYVVYGFKCAESGGRGAWLWSRAVWLMGFSSLVLPGLLLLFMSQLLGIVHGGQLERALSDYARYGAGVWGYVTPTAHHGLARVFHFDAYRPVEYSVVESGSYLGLVTLALMIYAAVHRVGFRGSGYWWSVFFILVVLSLGAYAKFGQHRIGLPSRWLWKYVFAFRLIRAPSRYNLLASIFAAVLAAAGLRHLLARFALPGKRRALSGLLIILAVADLAMVPFATTTLPAMPACYEMLKQRNPEMSLLEIPLRGSGNCQDLNAICGYWQSFHRGRTTGGYSGLDNVPFDNQLVHNSPFSISSMKEQCYLSESAAASFGIVKDVAFSDYAWLYLTVHDLKYIVLHRWPGAVPEAPAGIERLKALLAGAKIFEDGMTAVYERSLLKSPARPVMVCTDGWRGGWHGRPLLVVAKHGGVVVYNPAPAEMLTFTLEAKALLKPRTVRLLARGAELGRWVIQPSESRQYESPPFRLPGGVQSLVIESDGEERPAHRYEAVSLRDQAPFSLTVNAIRLFPADPAVVLIQAETTTRP